MRKGSGGKKPEEEKESRISNDTKTTPIQQIQIQIQIHDKYDYNIWKNGEGKKPEEGEESRTSNDTKTA